METAVFYVLATVSVASAVLLVLFRNPVYSALSLVATLFAVAGLFVLLNAYFLAAVQIIVYAGAVMVLFLFVIMLLNLGHPEALEPMTGTYRRAAVLLLGVLLMAQLSAIGARQLRSPVVDNELLLSENVSTIGKLLYTDFVFPFEIVSLILLVALIGVVVLVKRDAKQVS
jgi:NADH-quinone oxidoreductase subunit J